MSKFKPAKPQKLPIDKATSFSVKADSGKVYVKFDGLMYGWVSLTADKIDKTIQLLTEYKELARLVDVKALAS